MKKKLILLITVLSYGFMQSQEVNCAVTQQEFVQLVEKQNYKEAASKMTVLLNKCAAKDENLYLLGAKVIQNKIDLASNDDKEKAVKELISLYDKHDLNFPANTSNNLISKAMLYYDYDLATEAETFKLLDKAFIKDKFQFTSPLSLYTYFKLYNENYKSNDARNFDQLLERYSQVLTVVNKNKSLFPDKAVEYDNVIIGVKSIVKNYLTPENLTDYAERNIKANTNNVEWLSATVDLMLEKCADKAVFGTVAYHLHNLQPTSKSAYALGAFNLKGNNREKAVEFLQQAAELATEKSEKARIYSTNASILFGFDKKLAKEASLLAIQNDGTNGEYYLFLSNLYASAAQECGATPIEQKAVYYLANSYAQRASEVQPALKPATTALSDQYKKHDFTTKEREQIKKSDNKVTIDCWINETVVLR